MEAADRLPAGERDRAPRACVWRVHQSCSDARPVRRVGAHGATGLDYNVVYHKMDRMGLTPSEYDDIEGDVRLMEDAALATIRKNKK